MICRLCLLEKSHYFQIYPNTTEDEDKSNTADIIAKHLKLKTNTTDLICLDCYQNLEKFHNFWIQIKINQKMLSQKIKKIVNSSGIMFDFIDNSTVWDNQNEGEDALNDFFSVKVYGALEKIRKMKKAKSRFNCKSEKDKTPENSSLFKISKNYKDASTEIEMIEEDKHYKTNQTGLSEVTTKVSKEPKEQQNTAKSQQERSIMCAMPNNSISDDLENNLAENSCATTKDDSISSVNSEDCVKGHLDARTKSVVCSVTPISKTDKLFFPETKIAPISKTDKLFFPETKVKFTKSFADNFDRENELEMQILKSQAQKLYLDDELKTFLRTRIKLDTKGVQVFKCNDKEDVEKLYKADKKKIKPKKEVRKMRKSLLKKLDAEFLRSHPEFADV